MRRLLVAVVTLAVLGAPLPAPAQGHQPEWRDEFADFRPVEGVGTGLLLGGSALNTWLLETPDEPNWTGPILLDAPIRRTLRAQSPGTRRGFETASDVLLWTLVGYPFAVDSGVVSAGVYGDGTLAFQTAAAGAESMAVATFATTLTKHLVARQRPPRPGCGPDGEGPLYCSEQRNESFPSGHTSLAFTGASLICAVHDEIDLYGGELGDRFACWGALGAATATGVFRIVSDNHYFSDVAIGAVVGFLSGYLVPKLLHFGFGESSPNRPASRRGSLRPSPAFGGPHFGYSVRF